MSNTVSFSLSQFSKALSVITAGADDKGSATAEWLASQLKRAALSWLLDGSDALSQCLAKIETSGKASSAVKLRKVLRSIDYQFNDGGTKPIVYGQVAGFNLVKATDFISGQSSRCTDHARRVESANAFGQLLLITGNVVFAKPIREGEIDPLAPFGSYKPSTIATRLVAATDEQITGAIKRTVELLTILQEWQVSVESNKGKAAPAEAATAEADAAKAETAKAGEAVEAAEAAKAAKATEAAEAAKAGEAVEAAEAAKAAEAVEKLTTRARQTTKRAREAA